VGYCKVRAELAGQRLVLCSYGSYRWDVKLAAVLILTVRIHFLSEVNGCTTSIQVQMSEMDSKTE
jgi:hypothetical protein